jgi:riboflavin biosynthesis pyrimidine reductase
VRRLFPTPAETIDVAAAYAPPSEGRFVRLNMISSIDGAISIDGKSGALGGPGDHDVFGALRASADLVFVGAGTVRAEDYGPARLDDATRRARVARGQSSEPPIAVVSARGEFDFSTPFFTEATARPIIVTSDERAARVTDAAQDRAVVLGAGAGTVDLTLAVDKLEARGARVVLCEGGPGLNGELVRAGLLDELCLTLSPRIVGGDGPRVMAGPPLMPPLPAPALQLLESDGFLFFRLDLRAARG